MPMTKKQTNKQTKKNLSLATYTTTNPIVFVVTRSSSKDSAALRANTQCFKSRPAETDRINWYPISNTVISQYPVCLSPVTNQHQVRYTYTQTNDQSANSIPHRTSRNPRQRPFVGQKYMTEPQQCLRGRLTRTLSPPSQLTSNQSINKIIILCNQPPFFLVPIETNLVSYICNQSASCQFYITGDQSAYIQQTRSQSTPSI